MASYNDDDFSNGWDELADKFISIANPQTGATVIENWSRCIQPEGIVLDVGCGFGRSYTKRLLESDFKVFGIDASEALIHEHRARFPEALVKCESAQHSPFFDRTFDGIVSVGLIFLLSEQDQVSVLQKMAAVLKDSGRLLFTAPYQICEWDDLLTGKQSRSLGRDAYVKLMQEQGLSLLDEYTDEGENHYFDFQKVSSL